VRFTVRPTDAPERMTGDAREAASENALRKATAARRDGSDELVLGVDTVVTLDGDLYGKPSDADAARTMLRALAGRTHEVVSGLALLGDGREDVATAITEVTFRPLPEPMIDWYLATGEWRERAGGYAIQGAGAALVTRVVGDYENVVGLPVGTLVDLCPSLLLGHWR
jgi:septum formation protein